MSDEAGGVLLERARAAAAEGQWGDAFDLFTHAAAAEPLPLGDLPVAADVAYAAGHLDVTIELWERAHAALADAGDDVAAAGAAVRVAMHLLFDTALMAPVRGWLRRAERLLDGHGDSPVHAWCAVVGAYERMLSGDLAAAGGHARRAVEIGATTDPAAHALGQIASARLLILDGDVDTGLALLDDAGVAAISGELDALTTGVVYCELVCALQGLAQYDAAEQWTEAMERWCATNAIGSIHGRCRVHRAEILRLRGDYDDAEREALAACDELRPYLRRELGWPLTELGRIRYCAGDLDGAEDALSRAHRAAWDPEPGLALVHLARGDAVVAAAGIRGALERPNHPPSKETPPNTDLRRAPLLAAQVEIELVLGDVARARRAADELLDVAGRFRSKALLATADLALGRVHLAEGDPQSAAAHVTVAVERWNEIGAPYEEAVARRCLADALRAGGHEQRAEGEAVTADAMLARLETARRPRRRPVDEPPGRSGGEPDALRRDGDYWTVTFESRTAHVRDVKGMRYLARLLADPGRELHVLDLVATEGRRPTLVDGDAGGLLDAEAKQAYRRRLAEIDADLDDAAATGDTARATQASVEREFLVHELSRAFGLGGRGRSAGVASERARAAVTKAIRQAITRLGRHDARLGEHLDRAVRTGTYCSYTPDGRARGRWSL